MVAGAAGTPSAGERRVLGPAPGGAVHVRERVPPTPQKAFQAAQARQRTSKVGAAGVGLSDAAPSLRVVAGAVDKPERADQQHAHRCEPPSSTGRSAPLGAAGTSADDDVVRRQRLARFHHARDQLWLLPPVAGSPAETRRHRRDPPRLLREQSAADGKLEQLPGVPGVAVRVSAVLLPDRDPGQQTDLRRGRGQG